MRISDWSSDVCSSDLPFYRPVDRRDWGCSWITDMESPRKLRNEEAGELVADQHETGGHQHGVGRESLACERIAAAPEPHRDEMEENTSELQSTMRIPYAVLCFQKKNKRKEES